MSVPADNLKLLETVWYHNTIVQYASASAVTFYLHDCILTFKDEVEYFWKSRLTPIKVLFLINRYFAMVLAIVNTAFDVQPQATDFKCIFWGQFGIWSGIILSSIVEIILQFRVHALYNQNKIVFFVVSALFIIEVGSMCVIAGLYTHVRLQTPVLPIPGTPFCENSTTTSYLFAFQIPLMGFEFILLCLVLFKGILHYRVLQGTSWSTSRIVSVILRNSVLYFLSIFAVLLINTIMWEVGPPTLFPLAGTWSVVIPTTACNRMLINMRKAGGTMHHGSKSSHELGTLTAWQG